MVERGPGPGGRAGRVERAGYALDTGPSVFTAPEVLADTLAAVGEKLEERLTLLPLETTYRAQFADGSQLDVRADPDAFAREVAALCGPAEAAALRRYLADLAELYRLQLGTFIDRNLDSPLDLLGPELVGLARRGGFGRLSRHVERYFADDRLRRLFSFQALYAGVSPFRAIAAYAVIAQLDIGAGVWHPVGGIAAVPRALAAAAADAGVAFRYGTPAELEVDGSRVVAVRTGDGDRLPADAVVVTADQPHTLVPGLRGPRRPVYSPSCVALHLGVRAELPEQAHHTISFGESWRGVFDELTRDGRVMTDPTASDDRIQDRHRRSTPPRTGAAGRKSARVAWIAPRSAAMTATPVPRRRRPKTTAGQRTSTGRIEASAAGRRKSARETRDIRGPSRMTPRQRRWLPKRCANHPVTVVGLERRGRRPRGESRDDAPARPVARHPARARGSGARGPSGAGRGSVRALRAGDRRRRPARRGARRGAARGRPQRDGKEGRRASSAPGPGRSTARARATGSRPTRRRSASRGRASPRGGRASTSAASRSTTAGTATPSPRSRRCSIPSGRRPTPRSS